MEENNKEIKATKKTEISGNWLLAFFVSMFIAVVLLGKYGL